MAPPSAVLRAAAMLALTWTSTVNAQSACTTTGAVTPNAPVCPGSNGQSFVSPCGSNYTLTCNSDVDPAGAATNAAAASLSACIAQCDAYAGCRAAVFTGNLCYIKTSFTGLTNAGTGQALVRAIPPNPNYAVPFAAGNVNASSGCGQALPSGLVADGASVQYSTVTADGRTRIYRIHIPRFYDPLRASPLIFAFPGASATALEIESQTRFNDATINPYGIAVYVQGVNLGFQSNPNNNNVDDIGLVRALVANITASFCVDTGRMWASGFSNGGGFTNVLACNPVTSSLFSVFAANSGAFYTGVAGPGDPLTVSPVDTPVGVCSPSRNNIPFIEVHGTGDATINYYGEANRNGRVLPTIPRWTQAWATRQGYSTVNVTTTPAPGITKYVFGNSNNLGIITQYTLAGWSHNWASIAGGAQLDSSPLFMNFFYDQTSSNRVVAAVSSSGPSSSTSLTETRNPAASTSSTSGSTTTFSVSSSLDSSISTRTTLTFAESQPGLSCTPCSASSTFDPFPTTTTSSEIISSTTTMTTTTTTTTTSSALQSSPSTFTSSTSSSSLSSSAASSTPSSSAFSSTSSSTVPSSVASSTPSSSPVLSSSTFSSSTFSSSTSSSSTFSSPSSSGAISTSSTLVSPSSSSPITSSSTGGPSSSSSNILLSSSSSGDSSSSGPVASSTSSAVGSSTLRVTSTTSTSAISTTLTSATSTTPTSATSTSAVSSTIATASSTLASSSLSAQQSSSPSSSARTTSSTILTSTAPTSTPSSSVQISSSPVASSSPFPTSIGSSSAQPTSEPVASLPVSSSTASSSVRISSSTLAAQSSTASSSIQTPSSFIVSSGPISPTVLPTTASSTNEVTTTSDVPQETVYPPPPACPTDAVTLCAPVDTTTTCSSGSGQAYNVTCGVAYVGTVVQDSDIKSPPPYDTQPFVPPSATPSSGPDKRDLGASFEIFERRLPIAKRILYPDITTCQAACELSNTTETPCVAFNFNVATYNCTLFSEVTGTVQSADVVAAVPVPNPPVAVEYSTYATTTASTLFSTATTLAEASTTSPPVPISTNPASSASCPVSDGQTVVDTCGVQYLLSCGNDTFPGGDARIEDIDFNDCFAACSSGQNGACTGFTWTSNTRICYLKNGGNMFFQDPNVNAIGAINVDYYLDAAGPDAPAPSATTRVCTTAASTSSTFSTVSSSSAQATSTALASTTTRIISPTTFTASSTPPGVPLPTSITSSASSIVSSLIVPPLSSTTGRTSSGEPVPSSSPSTNVASSSSIVSQLTMASTVVSSLELSSSLAATTAAPTDFPGSSTTPSITTQSVSSTIAPCATETADICTSASTQIICSSSNETTYAVTCGIVYTGSEIPDDRANTTGLAKRFYTEDFGDCQQACTDTFGCVALNYVDSDCTLFDSVNSTSLAPGAVSAIGVPDNGIVPSYSLASSQATSSTSIPGPPESYASLSTTTVSLPSMSSFSTSGTTISSAGNSSITQSTPATLSASSPGGASSSSASVSLSMATVSTSGIPPSSTSSSLPGVSSPSPVASSTPTASPSTIVSSTPRMSPSGASTPIPSVSIPGSSSRAISTSGSSSTQPRDASSSSSSPSYSTSLFSSQIPSTSTASSRSLPGSQIPSTSTASSTSLSGSQVTSSVPPSSSDPNTPPISTQGPSQSITSPPYSSTAPTTVPTPSPPAALCPASNGQNYTNTQGVTYAVDCNTALTGITYTAANNNPRRQTTSTSESCMALCNTDPACLGINITPTSCVYFNSITGSIPAIGTTALEKIAVTPIPGGGLTVTVSVCRASTTRTVTAFTTVSIATCSAGSICPAAASGAKLVVRDL